MTKICTTIEQSKKLLKLGVDINSADMHYATWTILDGEFIVSPNQGSTIENLQEDYGNQIIPCWSLTSLLDYIKDKCGFFELVYLRITFDGRENKLENVYRLSTDVYNVYQKDAVDACVELIIKLHEQKLL